ncbi:MAG TPA: hypothetical protein PLQ35_11745 [bacterium]|nr:hypothetical protein [bacterium]HQL62957.1 hypothetical protein [bacterium]
MPILSKKAYEIIREELGRSLQDLASEPLNVVRKSGVQLLYPERARGMVRASTGKLLMPESIEQTRARVSKFRLAKKSMGIQRLLRHFR